MNGQMIRAVRFSAKAQALAAFVRQLTKTTITTKTAVNLTA